MQSLQQYTPRAPEVSSLVSRGLRGCHHLEMRHLETVHGTLLGISISPAVRSEASARDYRQCTSQGPEEI
jgi:hypothetical protein